jgi:hypothetical protein
MLGLRRPSWTSDGEILNLERYLVQSGPGHDGFPKFTTRASDPALFGQLTDFLDATASRQACAYKDVVQPFVVAAWGGLREFRVLYVRRDLAEVAYAMLRRRWYYPAAVVDSVERPRLRRGRRATRSPTLSESLVRGLLLAEEALEQVPAARIEFEDLLTSPDALAAVLGRLYPGVEHQPLDSVERPELVIGQARQHQLLNSPEYRALTDLVRSCREAAP